MKSRAILSILLALLLLLSSRTHLHASDTDKTTKAILALDSERADAQVRGDFTTLERVLGDDLTYVHASGLVQSKADFIADLKSGKRTYTSIKTSDVNVRLLKETAVVTARSEIHVVHEGKENDLSIRVTEVYALRKAHWELIAYQSTRVTP
ncbi:MAG: nuclear transport factor 2 family protein [Candidatus Sulfotelmatobacter sp.]|jgi:hypothetical protein